MSWREKILDSLECPVCCYPIVSAPIFQCFNGHSICSQCRHSDVGLARRCPLCREAVSNIRNYLVEDIIKSLLRPCVNYSVGCREVFKADYDDDYEDHLEECPYKQINCPACNDLVVLDNFACHVHDHEDGEKFELVPGSRELFKGKWIISTNPVAGFKFSNGDGEMFAVGWHGGIHFDGRNHERLHFYFIYTHNSTTDEVLIWCYADETESASKFFYSVEIGKKDKRFTKYAASCVSLGTPLEDVMYDREGLLLSSKLIRAFQGDNDKLSLTLTVKKPHDFVRA